MDLKVGYQLNQNRNEEIAADPATFVTDEIMSIPKKSVVQVHFPARNLTCTYFNDAYDLHCGDIVYVDGKLEGLRGRVVDVSYSFKIKLSDYKRVIGKADTDIRGKLYMADNCFLAFDPAVIPFGKVITWFKAPADPEEEFVSGESGSRFFLDNLSDMHMRPEIAERGKEYYRNERVVYLCVDGTCGRAIVEGSEPYEVEFDYDNGKIGNLVCSCFCSYPCKHEFAAMLQLREALYCIEEQYAGLYGQSGYFAAVSKAAFFSLVIAGKESGSMVLG